MRKIALTLTAGILGALSIVGVANAGGVGVGVKAGTLGAGIEVSYPVNSMLTVGIGINKFSRSMTDTADDIKYDVDLNLQTISLLANYHPFAGSFRLTAGAMINGNELKMNAKPNGAATYRIGDTDYNVSDVDSLKATVDFNKFAPYAGFGWGTSSDSGIGFSLDVGVLMQGEPKVDLTATGNALSIPGFQAELAKEEANAEDDIKDFTIYPVVSAGVDIRF